MTSLRFFGPDELEDLRRVLTLAEELCGEHFRLSAFDMRSAPYDVVTAAELSREGIGPLPEPSQLAEVRRCDLTREERSARDRRRTHYRICLWDPHVLSACDRGATLGAVLLYVLTHELVHVVRFAKQLARFDTTPQGREREEQIVHQVTLQILQRAREPGLRRLLEDLPELGGCLRRLAEEPR